MWEGRIRGGTLLGEKEDWGEREDWGQIRLGRRFGKREDWEREIC